MASLRQRIRASQVLWWDLWIRTVGSERIARTLTQASREVVRLPLVAFIESNTGYGNVRACALDLRDELGADRMCLVAFSDAGMTWAREHGIPAFRMSLAARSGANSRSWERLLRSAVTVHESHDWWRTRADLMKRSLIAGSYKIQLWHGSTGPIGKEIGLGRLAAQPTFWHFAAVAATSVSWDAMVHEPNGDEARRMDRVQSRATIHDIEYRLVPVLRDGTWTRFSSKTVVVAPTFPESVDGEATLVAWITRLGAAAADHEWELRVHLHPSTKKSVRKRLSKAPGVTLASAGVPSALLRECAAVVTDYSSIAHDALLIGTPVVMAVEGLEKYQASREILIDPEQWAAAYIADTADALVPAVQRALGEDDLASSRNAYRDGLLAALGAEPGANTRAAILEAVAKAQVR